MNTVVLTSDYTSLILNGRPITDFIEGDILELAPVNEHSSHVNASNGGVTMSKRTDGDVYDLTVRVQRFSDSDEFLQNIVNQQVLQVINGSAKEQYQKDGISRVESWTLKNGSVTTKPTKTRNTQDGNALSEYKIRFRNAFRNI